ncbi:MAG: GntR family transcriptional regulator [Actinobacteria bacterium]|nr:GntR family transcriptional regulator [Actinomycetota bacterium]
MALDLTLDRGSRLPLYAQLAEQLEQAIRDGSLQPGDRLETEVELAQRLGLGRPTVRQAVQELVSKGLLVRRRGVGTQVVRSPVYRPLELTSLHEDLTTGGQHPTTRVLELATVAASDEVARALLIHAGDPVVYLARLRSRNTEPLAVMHNWLPTGLVDLTPEQLEAESLYALMRRVGVHLRVAQQRIGARGADRAEGRLLAIRAGAPLLTMHRTSYDDNGNAVEFAAHCYRADSHAFETTLVAR